MSKASRRANNERMQAAQDVVERARAGDQVAMGLLAMVRDNAKKGDGKARQSLHAINRYIAKNPPQSIGNEVSGNTNPLSSLASKALWTNPEPQVVIAALPKMGFWQGVVALVHGPQLDNTRLSAIQANVPSNDQTDFKGGVLFWQKTAPPMSNPNEKSWILGRIVGLARCIQRLQLPSVPIATLCPVTAWELGE